jgi:N6-adenosine-specific RNA methylase IME4
MQPLIQDCKKNGGYNLVVMDCPWENRSVQRSKKYNTLPPHKILELPIPQLMLGGGLVVVWVTNNSAYHGFVQNNLFKRWGVRYLTTAHWLKLTEAGELVVPLDSQHRKPYEPFIIGVVVDERSHGQCPHTSHSQKTENEMVNKNELQKENGVWNLEQLQRDDIVVCSLANKLARKPVLEEFLREFLVEKETPLRCLELFARNLNRGWTSWGDQVLLFQERGYFERRE